MLADRDRLLRQMHGYNPWWLDKPVNAPEIERVALHKCLEPLLDPELRRAVMLCGPRRVGKSVILKQVARRLLLSDADPKSILYLSFDDNILKLAAPEELLDLYHEAVHPEDRPCVLLLDEVHYAKGWDTFVKTIIDHRPTHRVLVTGSASAEFRDKTIESGVGRWIEVHIPTLSFYEFLLLRGDAPPKIDRGIRLRDLASRPKGELAEIAGLLRPTLPHFARYLLIGGFPELVRKDDIGQCQQLLRDDVVDRVLKRDIPALYGVRNLADLEKLFIYLCLHTGGILNVTQCASELGVARTTVENHLAALRSANLVYRLPPYAIGGKKALKRQDKYYLVDAALRNAVLLSGEEILQDSEQMGRIVETAALRHLYAFYYPKRPRLGYWTDPKTKREVDVVLEFSENVIPVEVKHRSRPRMDAGSGVAAFAAKQPISSSFVVTRDDADFGVRDVAEGVRTFFVPAHVFMYVLGQAEMDDAARGAVTRNAKNPDSA